MHILVVVSSTATLLVVEQNLLMSVNILGLNMPLFVETENSSTFFATEFEMLQTHFLRRRHAVAPASDSAQYRRFRNHFVRFTSKGESFIYRRVTLELGSVCKSSEIDFAERQIQLLSCCVPGTAV